MKLKGSFLMVLLYRRELRKGPLGMRVQVALFGLGVSMGFTAFHVLISHFKACNQGFESHFWGFHENDIRLFGRLCVCDTMLLRGA